MHGGIVHSRHGERQDEVTERVIEDCPHKGGGEIPKSNVDPLFFSTDDCHNDLDRHQYEHELDENVVPYRELSCFDTQVLTESKRDETGGQAEIPEPEDCAAPAFLVHANTTQARDHVVRQAEDC